MTAAINLILLHTIFTCACSSNAIASSLFNETELLQLNNTTGFDNSSDATSPPIKSPLFDETEEIIPFNATSATTEMFFNETEEVVRFNHSHWKIATELGASETTSEEYFSTTTGFSGYPNGSLDEADYPQQSLNITTEFDASENSSSSTITTDKEFPIFSNEDTPGTATVHQEGHFDNPSTNESTVAPPRTYRHVGYANDTTAGLLLTLVDDYGVPCLKMLLKIMITVYFKRNETNCDVWHAAYFPQLPVSYKEVSVEGECSDNSTASMQISWKQHLLTWTFAKEQSGDHAWSFHGLTFVIGDTEWIQKYNFCESPCEPFVFSSYHDMLMGSMNNSYRASEQIPIHLKHNETSLKALVFLIKDQFEVDAVFDTESD